MGKANRLVFLPVPESLRDVVLAAGGETSLRLDPSIPLPVELPPGAPRLDLEALSWEMILAGMLRVMADNSPEQAGAALSFEAIEYYRRFVLAVKPNIMEEFTGAARIKAEQGDYDLALEIMDALGGLFPGSPAALLNRALIREQKAGALEQAGREAEAEQENNLAGGAYRELLALTPRFPRGLFNAAFFYLKNRRFAQAKECFAAYIPLAEEPGKRSQAEAVLREIEAQGLDDPAFQEAYEAVRQGDAEQGVMAVREFLQRRPQGWNGWFILGWGLRKLGRYQEAAASLRQALECGGGNCDTRNELAICLMELGEYGGARKELELALREAPENLKIISNLGVLAMKDGRTGEAAAFFRTVAALEPSDRIARLSLAALGMPADTRTGSGFLPRSADCADYQ
ncbi:MAG: tetratricopeptide repeat protein [Treponema sp.]|jgi:tetratricopeptide (TPR) repeat protein|nr:tetratricopeptide repeat protein [Treponema sp.]